ncbi:hypothetical protein BDV28DRAFT_145009 [Aspergillus coremiiformis]|uniref:BTB domain-containing protein n=1 Tax=Aspergillus coremiiformis TaxID=138285 RepID=A0A5N6ZGT6_9EURO|nr:hypothetical protein BDV28DRAFT_145009 [Aspergillus coremiiformis]
MEAVDPDGDVIIECDDQYFRVSSKILATASPVFSALFKPHFREGASMVGGSIEPVVITLHDDDPEALLAFFNLVHFRSDALPANPSTTCLEHFAVLVDKYMCRAATEAQGRRWLLARKIKGLAVPELCQLLLLAYIVDSPSRFAAISKQILFTYSDSFSELSLLRNHPLLPNHIVAEFEAKKHEIGRIVRKAITGPFERMTTFNPAERCMALYISKLRHFGLLPGTDIFEAKTFQQVCYDIFKLPNFHSQACKVKYCVCKLREMVTQDKELKALFQKCETANLGLCMDCIKSKRSSFRNCRYAHSNLGDDKAIFGKAD